VTKKLISSFTVALLLTSIAAHAGSATVSASGECAAVFACPQFQAGWVSVLQFGPSFDLCIGPFLDAHAVVYGNNATRNPAQCIQASGSTSTFPFIVKLFAQAEPAHPIAGVGLDGGGTSLSISASGDPDTHLTIASACLHVWAQPSSADTCSDALVI
jgi:ABC-type phosphate transport system substrate-binding protein